MKEAAANAQNKGTEPTGSEIVRLLTCSDLRKNLILALNNGSASLADLREQVDVSSTAAIHALRELEKDYLTTQDDKRNYALTNVGRILALKLEDLVKTANVLAGQSKFWLEHDLSGIPEPSLERLGSLEESYLLTSTSTDIFKVYSTFITLIENAEEIKGISSFLVPDLMKAFSVLVHKGKAIELIVTSDVFDTMAGLTNRQQLTEALEGGLKLFKLDENPKIGLTVTDYFLSLGLFRWDGMYDYSNDLLSYSNQAIDWGRGLFDHYVEVSEEITLSKFPTD